MFDVNKYNQGVRASGKSIKEKLKASLSDLGIGQTGELFKTINTTYKKNHGEIYAVGISITRAGVFVEKGVGRGVPIDSAKSNSNIIGRVKKPWFNPVIEKELPKLADFVVRENANAIIDTIKIN